MKPYANVYISGHLNGKHKKWLIKRLTKQLLDMENKQRVKTIGTMQYTVQCANCGKTSEPVTVTEKGPKGWTATDCKLTNISGSGWYAELQQYCEDCSALIEALE